MLLFQMRHSEGRPAGWNCYFLSDILSELFILSVDLLICILSTAVALSSTVIFSIIDMRSAEDIWDTSCPDIFIAIILSLLDILSNMAALSAVDILSDILSLAAILLS